MAGYKGPALFSTGEGVNLIPSDINYVEELRDRFISKLSSTDYDPIELANERELVQESPPLTDSHFEKEVAIMSM